MRLTKKDFGKRLRKSRERIGLTQAELGALVGDFSQKAVSEWEAGLAEPDIPTIGLLAQALATTVGWLVAGEGEAPSGRKAKLTTDILVDRKGPTRTQKDA